MTEDAAPLSAEERLRAALAAVFHETRYEQGVCFHEPTSGYRDCESFAADAIYTKAVEALTIRAPGSPTDAALRAAWTIDSALQASLDTEAVATGPWAGKRWVPAGAFIDLDLPCPMRSSITDQPCALRWGHPADSGTRFHRFAPPGAASGSPEPVLDRLRAAIEAELALLPDEPTQFDMGAAAAYHWCLAALATQ